jgi:hypothetical protein
VISILLTITAIDWILANALTVLLFAEVVWLLTLEAFEQDLFALELGVPLVLLSLLKVLEG